MLFEGRNLPTICMVVRGRLEAVLDWIFEHIVFLKRRVVEDWKCTGYVSERVVCLDVCGRNAENLDFNSSFISATEGCC